MRISDWSSDVCSSDLLIKRTYITPGFAAWLMLLPLALTSTRGWQRRLRRRWAQLHKLIYPAAVLGEIVRASCRERVCQHVWISVVAVSINKKKRQIYES